MKDMLIVEEIGKRGRVILGEYDNEKDMIEDLRDYILYEKRNVKVFKQYDTIFDKNRKYIT